MINAIDTLREVSSILKGYGIEAPQKEAEIILAILGIERIALYRDNPAISEVQLEELNRVLRRRQRREPLQYIIGHVDFNGLKIKVGPGVLIPRPETELIVEEVIKTADGRQPTVSRSKDSNFRLSPTDHRLNVLDLCTGSGCLALAIAKHHEKSDVVGTDFSLKTLEYARENARINGIRNVTFLQGDLYEPLRGRRFDIIVSNPPYIKREDIDNLAPEIKGWEPVEAVDGGEDGLHFYKRIISQSPDHLSGGGSLILELGQGEAGDVMKMAENSGLKCLPVIKDYAGIERILHLILE